MNKKIKKVLIFSINILFFFMEILIFFLFSKNDEILNFRSMLWISHFILSVAFIMAFKYFIKENIGFYDVFIIIFPVIGISVFLMDNIFSLWKVRKAIADEVLGKNKNIKNTEKEENYNISEFNVMSSYDLLLSENNNIKKKFLFSYEGERLKSKIKILLRALKDENTEVIHYAATEINKLDTEIQEKINIAEKEREKITDKKKLKKKDYDIFKMYKEYTDSGLLSGEILDFYQNKTINLLNNLEIDEKEKELFMIEIYENVDNNKKYENLLKKRIDKYKERDIITRYLKFLYRENRFEELLNEYKKYEKLGNMEIEKPVFLMTD